MPGASLQAALEGDWERLLVVDLDERAAGRCAIAHGLRGLDAIHLAAALELAGMLDEPRGDAPSTAGSLEAGLPGEAFPDSLVFSSYDDRLRAVAAAAGLWVAPVLSSP